MTTQDLTEITELMERAMLAPNKSIAQPIIDELNFKASSLDISPDAKLKLKEAICFAASAAGQSKDKVHWMSSAKQSSHVFKRNVGDLPSD
jgi:hypothetical protein